MVDSVLGGTKIFATLKPPTMTSFTSSYFYYYVLLFSRNMVSIVITACLYVYWQQYPTSTDNHAVTPYFLHLITTQYRCFSVTNFVITLVNFLIVFSSSNSYYVYSNVIISIVVKKEYSFFTPNIFLVVKFFDVSFFSPWSHSSK